MKELEKYAQTQDKSMKSQANKVKKALREQVELESLSLRVL